MSTIYTVIPAAPGFIYYSANRKVFDILAWAFAPGSALPIPVTVLGPQPRKGAAIDHRDYERADVIL